MINYKELANLFLDNFVESFGAIETIGFLYSRRYTKEQIKELGFNDKDIDEVNNLIENEGVIY